MSLKRPIILVKAPRAFCASSLKRGIKRSSIQRKFYYIRCSKPQFICKKAIIWHISCSAWSFPQTFLDAVFRLPAQSFSFLLWLILSTIIVGISPRTTFSHFQSLKFLCWFWSSYLDIFYLFSYFHSGEIDEILYSRCRKSTKPGFSPWIQTCGAKAMNFSAQHNTDSVSVPLSHNTMAIFWEYNSFLPSILRSLDLLPQCSVR